MNDTLKTIFNRRSVRTFKPEQIENQALDSIVSAGQYAPSGMNHQPWHFTVVQNRELLADINTLCKAVYMQWDNPALQERVKAENFSAFYHAPTLIVVSGDATSLTPQFDCALALGTMFLAAASLGIGSCWIHALQSFHDLAEGPAMMKKLQVPEGYRIFGSGAFGYSAQELPLPKPRKEGAVTILR
ncbi:nitroreductase [Heliorestis convoluta]|nr:nitroreductase [Heliorestis convoluta]